MSKKIIAVVNQKGGVGKTTTAINLATALASIDYKILLIDLDPQGNASTGMGISQRDRDSTAYDLLVLDTPIEKVIKKSNIPKIDIISSTVDLSGAELELVSKTNRELTLKNKLSRVIDDYDYIIIDCPPSLGLLTVNALVASRSVLVPLQCEFFALEGLSHLLKTVELVKKRLNPNLEIEGVLLTMYDRRYNLTSQVEEDVRGHLGQMVFETIIPRNVRVSEAPSHGKPAIIYDFKCAGSLAYIRLAKEILEKEGKRNG
jgi:chromosome partitioning protein